MTSSLSVGDCQITWTYHAGDAAVDYDLIILADDGSVFVPSMVAPREIPVPLIADRTCRGMTYLFVVNLLRLLSQWTDNDGRY